MTSLSPVFHSRAGKFSISYSAARLWNALPADSRSSDYSYLSAQLKLWLGHPVRRLLSVGSTLVKQNRITIIVKL